MLLLLLKEKLEVNLMLSFKALEEKKKTNVKINPKKNDLLEKQKKHPEDCTGCEKCEDEKEEKVVEGVADAVLSGTYHAVKTGAKRHKEAVQKKKIKNRKAVPYAALAAEHEPEGDEIVEQGIEDILARLEKKRISKGGNPDDSPLGKKTGRAMKAQQDKVRKKAGVKEEMELEEERAARKMNVRTKGTIKKQIAKDAAAEAKRREKKTGEYAEKPKKRPRLKKPSQLTKVTGASKPAPKKEAPKPKAKPVAKKAAPKPKAKKKEAPRTQKGAMAYDGPNKARSQAADRVKAKTKAKQKSLPKKKEAPKSKSVGDRVRDVIKKGVKRHKKAVQPARVFAKGFKKGVKDTAKFAAKAKKAVVGEGRITFRQFNEATRLKKEKGYDKGGTKKPSGKKDAALSFVLDKIRKEHGKGAVMTGGSRQQKKVKGAKSTAGTGKYKKAADQKKQTAADAKKRGFKSSQDYVNTIARYGGKDNYDKGKGLGT
jgi:hypothetical protein